MTTLFFVPLVLLGSFVAGLLGALTGLGGGVVIVPLLVVAFHVNIHYAIGASLISVIATSSGSAAAYVREGFSNIRIGMFLEIATTIGRFVWRLSRRAIGRRLDRHCLWRRVGHFFRTFHDAGNGSRNPAVRPIGGRRA